MHQVPMWVWTLALAALCLSMKKTMAFAFFAAVTAVVMFTDVPWATHAITAIITWLQNAPTKLG
jgi:hypothetical protein